MAEVFTISVRALQPSQLFVNEAKLLTCLADPEPAPIPVADLDGALICTDGHSRALAALVGRRPVVAATPETDDLNWDLYRACVAWCHERDIRSVVDLRHRVVPSNLYQTLWLDRCARLHRQRGVT